MIERRAPVLATLTLPDSQPQQPQTPSGGAGVTVSPAHVRSYVRLLVTVFAAFVISGTAEHGKWELTVLSSLLGATLLIALHAAEVRSGFLRAAAVVVVVVVTFTLLQALVGGIDERLARASNAIVVSLAPPIILLGVVRRVRSTQSVPIDALLGVLCVYMLLGLFFSSVYGAVNELGGHHFFAQPAPATIANCTYFSFTTLATVGYGDLTAATNVGHTLSVSEALVGQVYLVTVVSLIISNLGRRRPAVESDSPPV
jgi:hypothetical protein